MSGDRLTRSEQLRQNVFLLIRNSGVGATVLSVPRRCASPVMIGTPTALQPISVSSLNRRIALTDYLLDFLPENRAVRDCIRHNRSEIQAPKPEGFRSASASDATYSLPDTNACSGISAPILGL